jgi:hypothetical protein
VTRDPMYTNIEEPRYVGVFKARPVLYVAHPLRPSAEDIAACDVQNAPVPLSRTFLEDRALRRNIDRAIAWRDWLRATFPDVTFVAPWIGDVLAGDDDSDPVQRARGIRDNCALIAKLDGVVLCGPRISGGMRAEVDAFVMREAHDVARGDTRKQHVYDLTSLGATPPEDPYLNAGDMFDSWCSRVKR